MVIPREVGVVAGVAFVGDVGLAVGRPVVAEGTDEVDWDAGVVNPGFVGAVVVWGFGFVFLLQSDKRLYFKAVKFIYWYTRLHSIYNTK